VDIGDLVVTNGARYDIGVFHGELNIRYDIEYSIVVQGAQDRLEPSLSILYPRNMSASVSPRVVLMTIQCFSFTIQTECVQVTKICGVACRDIPDLEAVLVAGS
jgi:hypothetical protein